MKSWKKIAMGTSLFASLAAQANIVGISSHPWGNKTSMFNGELSGQMTGDSAKGVQLRYLHKVDENLNVDGGFKVTDGQNSSRAFVGADYLIFPDYGDQPRVSIKGMLESNKEFGHKKNLMGLAPIVSKAVVVSEHEIFPFVSLPVRLNLDANNNTYVTQTSLAMGLTTPVYIEGFENMVANFETNINLKNSYSSVAFGITMPIK